MLNTILTEEIIDLIKLPSMSEWGNTEFDCKVKECVEQASVAIDWHKKTNCRADIKINHSLLRKGDWGDNEYDWVPEVWQMTVLHGKGEVGLLEIGEIDESKIINWLIDVHKYEGIV